MLLTHTATVLIRNSIFRVVHLGSPWTGVSKMYQLRKQLPQEKIVNKSTDSGSDKQENLPKSLLRLSEYAFLDRQWIEIN